MAGKETHMLNVPAKGESLEVVLGDVYRQTMSMGDGTIDGAPRLHLKSRELTAEEIKRKLAAGLPRYEVENMRIGRSATAGEITLEAWMEELEAIFAEQDERFARWRREAGLSGE